MTRIATSVLFSFVALAIVAVALAVNWVKASARTSGADTRQAHRPARPAAIA